MRRLAMVLKLIVALKYLFSIRCRVPYLPSVEASAVSAYDLGGEDALCGIGSPYLASSFELVLDHLPHVPVDDGGMAVLHYVFWKLTVVFDRLMVEEVLHVGLLEDGVPLVLLVPKNRGHRVLGPLAQHMEI